MAADSAGVESATPGPQAKASASARDSVLTKIEAKRRLWVPASTRPTGQVVRARPPGTHLRRGERLIESVQQSDHAVLAPVDGTVGTVETVRLLDGRQVTAVALDPDPPAGASLSPAIDGTAIDRASSAGAPPRAQPSADLFGEVHGAERGTWIDEIRHAGIWADCWGSPDLTAQL